MGHENFKERLPACVARWSKIVEWLRYGLYNKERSTSVDASSDHADLYSLIHSIFKGTPVCSYKLRTTPKLYCALK